VTTVRRLAAGYFIIQGLAALLWCFLLPGLETRRIFRLEESDISLLAFQLPDFLLLGLGSLLAGFLLVRASGAAPFALWMIAGSMSYAMLYTLGFSLLSGYGWTGIALMAPAMVLSLSFAAALTPMRVFRQARNAGPAYNMVKTALQITIFWGILLFLFPSLITELEERTGSLQFGYPGQRWSSGVLFLACSALGLWSGFTMARRGAGTPLPLDSTTKLVIHGPYGYLRNPMAAAGLGQGLAIGLWLGSPFVLAYALLGTMMWQYIARPLEEEELLRQFGEPYEQYREYVHCWIPRPSPYRAGGTLSS
jgi:protein-S-isoprenylcysteine O-methyltransferase Ste14